MKNPNQRSRKWTIALLEAMDDEVLNPRAVADMCLSYMSEWDVEDMCRINDLKELLSGEDEE